jgi:CRISPR-associated protein Cas2
MASKKRKQPSFVEILRKVKGAGLREGALLKAGDIQELALEDLNDRLKKLLNIYESGQKTSDMIFFVMYDIEHNKVRTHIAKYLIRKGCIRLQKSVFIAQKPRNVFDELHTTLKEVQDLYDNEDSILFLPVSTDEVHAMKVIGRNLSFDMVMENRNTIIF